LGEELLSFPAGCSTLEFWLAAAFFSSALVCLFVGAAVLASRVA